MKLQILEFYCGKEEQWDGSEKSLWASSSQAREYDSIEEMLSDVPDDEGGFMPYRRYGKWTAARICE